MGDRINGINAEAERHRQRREAEQLRAQLCGEFGRPAPLLELPPPPTS